jgi:hypothetical protein
MDEFEKKQLDYLKNIESKLRDIEYQQWKEAKEKEAKERGSQPGNGDLGWIGCITECIMCLLIPILLLYFLNILLEKIVTFLSDL